MHFPDFKNELEGLSDGYDFVLGCDEVGVGPLAGPVVAAACLLDPKSIGKYRSKSKWYYRVRDSKTTNESERETLLKEIFGHTLHFGIGVVSQKDIDKLNIHRASLEAMRLAILKLLKKIPKSAKNLKILVLLDGRFKIPSISLPGITLEQKNLVKGDSLALSISAASIIAKVHRDNIMRELDAKFPEYGFGRHKGYGTKGHKKALKEFGLTEHHRRSFFKNQDFR